LVDICNITGERIKHLREDAGGAFLSGDRAKLERVLDQIQYLSEIRGRAKCPSTKTSKKIKTKIPGLVEGEYQQDVDPCGCNY